LRGSARPDAGRATEVSPPVATDSFLHEPAIASFGANHTLDEEFRPPGWSTEAAPPDWRWPSIPPWRPSPESAWKPSAYVLARPHLSRPQRR
jgi:hypothetical protein